MDKPKVKTTIAADEKENSIKVAEVRRDSAKNTDDLQVTSEQ